MEKLKKKIEGAPRILKFRGRRVVHSVDWTWADWTKLPAEYIPLMINSESTPSDWYRDYLALMSKLQDPDYGGDICWRCAIHQAQSTKHELDQSTKYLEEEENKNPKEISPNAKRNNALKEVEWRIYNELAQANNRTCAVVNYFKCPYGKERRTLIENGTEAYELWQQIEWYNEHWNGTPTMQPPKSEMKWYHLGEPAIINITSLDDITKATSDGRLNKITLEHERYLKETGRKN